MQSLFLVWIEAVKHLKLPSDNTENTGIFSFFFFSSLYSKSTEYILFFYIWSAKQHFLYERQMNESMNAMYLQDRQLPAGYAGLKWKSRDHGMGALITQIQRIFKVQSLFAEGPSDSSLVPGGKSPLNTPVKELPSPCAWKFYLTGHCSLVGRPTWASGR